MNNARFQTVDGQDLNLEGVTARGRIVGRMLDMHLELRYRNPETANVEVVYTFPLPWQGVLLGLEVELNGETLKGTVKARSAARAQYEEALSEGDTGVLLTVNHDGTYTLELGNLMAGESCVVRLHYTQVLQPEQGSLRLMLPTTLAPRYGDPIADGGYEPHAAPEADLGVEYPFDIQLTVMGELVTAQIGSPTHPVAIRSLPAVGIKQTHVVDIRLAARAWLDRDFVLLFTDLPQASQGLAAWDRLDNGLGVVMAGFTPQLPTRVTLPVTMKVLVDCSGSMNGDSIQAARRALQGVLAGLKEGDRFSLSRFGSEVEHRSKALWKAAPAALASARNWVEALEADMGGTRMNDAILSTLALPGTDASDLLLVTDGDIHAIDDVLESARQSGHRFFVVGIGSSVSEGLIRRLAEDTGGSGEFVAPGEQVEAAILRLYHRMRSPVVRDARVQWPSGCTLHAASNLPRSLFEGDDITVFARLQAHQAELLTQPVQLWGRLDGVEGEVLLAELTPEFIADEDNTLARLAAYRRYTQLRQGGDEVPAVLTKQLPALAERYQLVTNDTSLVLVKERADRERAQEMPQLRRVKGMLAAGYGGHGSVIAYSMRESVSSGRLQFGKDSSSSRAPHEIPSDRLRQIEAKAARKLKHPGRSDKLSAFIDSFDTGPKATETAKGPQDPPKTDEFWNDGSAYSNDPSEWHKYAGLTPAGLVEWLRLNPQVGVAYAHFILMEAPLCLQVWLGQLIKQGHPEDEVIRLFMEQLLSHDLTFRQTVAKALGHLKVKPTRPGGADALLRVMKQSLSGLTSERWPDAVVHVAEDTPTPQRAKAGQS
jgi:Ca-activated chloride channel homolog